MQHKFLAVAALFAALLTTEANALRVKLPTGEPALETAETKSGKELKGHWVKNDKFFVTEDNKMIHHKMLQPKPEKQEEAEAAPEAPAAAAAPVAAAPAQAQA